MSEQADRDTQAVADAVIGGNIEKLGPALSRLADSDPAKFLRLTGKLIDATQVTRVVNIGLFGITDSEFYHADGMVFGSVYTPDEWFSRKVGPCGVGIPYDQVSSIANKVRAEYDETVLKKAMQVKESLEELDRLLNGHSFANSKLTSMAHADLFKGHALLVAALNPVGR
ncbi:hypothetical protein [Pseudomonas paracarnis]|uniref:Histidine kinase n=1 Tax=Pseudomonas paracarnis TaxID=2750625 RepID=A0ABU6BNV0_9PSED|nr:hypothetical protein [Pseudomonas paracarnis]MBW9245000.1 hypothetical protein [Pseudomonas paracarnis]MEB3781993.1 hypothetical protein [Pseudomonas paracarnis]